MQGLADDDVNLFGILSATSDAQFDFIASGLKMHRFQFADRTGISNVKLCWE